MRLTYIVNARIPTERAHGIQIMQMCEAFAASADLELVVPGRLNWIKEDPFKYYGIKKNFGIKKLPCLDLIPLHKKIGHLGLWVESATFNFFALPYVFFKKADAIYTRDKFFLPLVIFKKNIILEIHDFPRKYFLYSLFLKRLKGMVVITQKLKDLFIEKGIAADKILVIPDGVDVEMFNIQISKPEARERLSLPRNKKIVLYAGHLYDWKGVQILVEASKKLSHDAEVYFVGGTAEDVEKFKFRCSGLQNIRIIGHRPHSEIPYWLKAADVLVLPNSGKDDISRYWTSPLKMFEYMASKRPIVASDLSSIREILNESNAVLVGPDNPRDLAEGINRVLENQDLADSLADRAFNDVQNFTWEKRANRIIKGMMGRV